MRTSLILAFLCLAPAVAAAAAPVTIVAKWPLDKDERIRVDRIALARPPETFVENKVNLLGTVPAWLFTRLGLTLDEEIRRSKTVAAEILGGDKIVPTPAGMTALLTRLTAELPPGPDYAFTLTVLDRPGLAAFSTGGGSIFLSKRLSDLLLSDKSRGETALAFMVAREIAHNSLLHCRRGYQLTELEETVRKELDRADPAWRDALQTRVESIGRAVLFLYSREQEYEADLFALHLCRNAGYELDAACDAMRFLCAVQHPDAVTRDDYLPKANRLPAVKYYLSLTADPLLRLRRLLMEKDGEVEKSDVFGMARFDRTTREVVRLRPGDIKSDQRPVVFVHGLYGTLETFRVFLDEMADTKDLDGRPILVFRHPANASLSKCSLYLAKQVKELLPRPEKITFVGHSAGGLIIRCYAEVLGGKFDRAILLGPPNGGSDLAKIKALIDVIELAGKLRLGWVNGVSNILEQGRGEIGLDLQPKSLFLRRLTGKRDIVSRYHVFYGEFLGPVQAALLQLAFTAGAQTLEKRVVPSLPPGDLRVRAARSVAGLQLPAEILRGDGVVAATSAKLAGAAENTRMMLNHIAFCRDGRAVDAVLRILSRE